MTKTKEKSSKNTHKLYKNSYKKIFSNEKSMYDSKKEKSFENTHKLHKNSKTYLDVQNEFAP